MTNMIQRVQPVSYYQALGYTARLLVESELHANWPVQALAEDIRPPLMLNQFQLFCDQAQNLVGFVSWAWVTTDGAQILMADSQPLPFSEWRAGPHLYIADFIAPWGHARSMTRLLRQRDDNPGTWFGLRRTIVGTVRRTAGLVPGAAGHVA